MHDITVCKFGGTSLADAECFRRVRDIIRADERRRCIVVSAPGKAHASDKKVTDMLLEAHSCSGKERRSLLNDVRAKFCRIAADLGIQPPYSALADLGKYAKQSRDAIASRGEYLSALFMAEFTGFAFVDSADLFIFRDGRLDISASYENLKKLPEKAVIPGFYGSDECGSIVTFPRGGSDITAAHISAALNADLYENWTDVDGFFTADPRIVPEAQHIPHLDFKQAKLFSYIGAGVIHHESISPAADAGIPILIKNTFSPETDGTLISANLPDSHSCVACMPNENGQCLLSCAGITQSTAARIISILPREMYFCEYGSTLTIECPAEKAHGYARHLHEICVKTDRYNFSAFI